MRIVLHNQIMHRVKCLCQVAAGLLLLMGSAPSLVMAQAVHHSGVSQKMRITYSSAYRWFDGAAGQVREGHSTLSVMRRLGSRWHMQAWMRPTHSSGENVASLGSFGDLKFRVQYTHSFERGRLRLGTVMNLPTGKKTVSSEQFTNWLQLSRQYLGLRPGFGQAFHVTPSVHLRWFLTEKLSMEVGGALKLRAGYRLLDERDASYEPGSEFQLAGSVRFRVRKPLTLAAQVAYTSHGRTRFGEALLEPGVQVSTVLMVEHKDSFNALRVEFRHAFRGRSSQPMLRLGTRSLPSLMELGGQYRKRYTNKWYITLRAAHRFYSETEVISRDGQLVRTVGRRVEVDVALSPEYHMGRRIWIFAQGGYTHGEASGPRVSVGITFHR